jgi:hypothetical protein
LYVIALRPGSDDVSETMGRETSMKQMSFVLPLDNTQYAIDYVAPEDEFSKKYKIQAQSIIDSLQLISKLIDLYNHLLKLYLISIANKNPRIPSFRSILHLTFLFFLSISSFIVITSIFDYNDFNLFLHYTSMDGRCSNSKRRTSTKYS